ncbi:PREDICTED: glycosylated lysosomal membrane protein A-like [Eufriesea mexicana]|uniref:glycosylated lysosomal membrane protein A-like n=1 Tax=Eufriesea mexicana TaxID=516756 RepID=UPI00083C5521|nr:PREDICTED: glycosylated lysosomal membrane protein A-like [Eufriesea mexicana]
MNYVFVLLFLFIIVIDTGYCTQRTLRSWLNHDCGTICRDKNLTTVYLRADGANDTLHYLWDFDGNPSVLLALTSPSASMNISWEDFLMKRKNSITFTEEPIYTFGVVFNKIIEFNDINDTALIDITNIVNTNILHPMFYQWDRKTLIQNTEFVTLNMEGNYYNDSTMNVSRQGSVKLSLRGFCSLDHSEAMPHMLHTENSTQVDIILDNIQTNKSFTNSRFAIELLVVGEGNPDIPMFINPKKSLDDEHTPGIFEVVEVRTPPYKSMENYQTEGAYLQWKPISYGDASRDVSSTIETIQYPPLKVTNHTSAIVNSMLYSYYGDKVNDLLTQRIIVSFGTKGDGFYKKTYYSTWTFLIGYGTPPNEKFSQLVIMIISIGVGLPLIILVAIGTYLCIRKLSKRNSEAYLSQ